MKIVSMEILSAGTSWRNLIVVQLTTDHGLVGVGEATIEYGDRALMAYLPEIFARAVRGQDPLDVDSVVAAMVRADYWRSGFIARTAFSAVELDCWDIRGRHANQPVWKLLGTARQGPLPAYANGWYRTERDPEVVARAAAQVAARGYRALKIDPFGTGDKTLSTAEFDRSLAIVRYVRHAVGDEVELLVEGHGRFDLAWATKIAQAIEAYRPGFFEEPLIPELNYCLPELVNATEVPIALGERCSSPTMLEWLSRDCERLILQPDICHVGGLLAAREVVHMAEERGWRIAPHNAGGPLATTQATHLGLASSAVMVQETFDDFEEPWVCQAFLGSARFSNGALIASNEPGFGVQVQQDILAAHPFVDRHMDLYSEGWEQRRTETLT